MVGSTRTVKRRRRRARHRSVPCDGRTVGMWYAAQALWGAPVAHRRLLGARSSETHVRYPSGAREMDGPHGIPTSVEGWHLARLSPAKCRSEKSPRTQGARLWLEGATPTRARIASSLVS